MSAGQTLQPSMLRFLLYRPIGVLLSVAALLTASLLAVFHLPVSLLPELEVPAITVRVRYPNASPAETEQNALRPIRDALSALDGLKQIESRAGSESGVVELLFDYGVPISLLYIEVNEKIDRLTDQFPPGMPRPQVNRLNVSDIPVMRLQVIPKDVRAYPEVSELANRVLKKRFEQLEGVALVDLNGKRQPMVSVSPDPARIRAYGLDEAGVLQAIEQANRPLGGLSVRDGYFRYYLKVGGGLEGKESVAGILVQSPSGPVPLSALAEVRESLERPLGYHLYNGQEGLVLTVHKQPQAQVPVLMPKLRETVSQLMEEYPSVSFAVTQDQSALLEAGIGNLRTSLLFGGLFAFLVLFLFLGNPRLPLVMGISLPVSLLLSFLLFQAFGLTINIVSLSGLALGLGMLIDNAIIVLDNISRYRVLGLGLADSCVKGTTEVMGALTSSVLTTLSVFVPLVFLSGVAGALFYDQAVSVAVILGVSLLVAFVLLPLLYRLLVAGDGKRAVAESPVFRPFRKAYDVLYHWVFRFRAPVFALLLLLSAASGATLGLLPREGLPAIARNESLLRLDWNEAVDVVENLRRVRLATQVVEGLALVTEADAGLNELLLQAEEARPTSAEIYMRFSGPGPMAEARQKLAAWLQGQYPQARWELVNAPNAFDQLFSADKPYFEARIRSLRAGEPVPAEKLSPLLADMAEKQGARPGAGTGRETVVHLETDREKLLRHGLKSDQVQETIRRQFSDYTIAEIKQFGSSTPIRMPNAPQDLAEKLNTLLVGNGKGGHVPLGAVVSHRYETGYAQLAADRLGLYHAAEWAGLPPPGVQQAVKKAAAAQGLNLDFKGQYFDDQENLRQLAWVFAISVALLYFILAAQFESFLQPLIVVFTLPLGVGGSVLLLALAGQTLNVMSAIGIIVMLGIMVNDAILKVDTYNQLLKKSLAGLPAGAGKKASRAVLAGVLHEAGTIRLKPVLMTTVTTVLALTPVVFAGGLGGDLQRPLALAVAGGLAVGSFTALFFVPLGYWFIYSPGKTQGRPQ